jgi:hypothetical protein
MFVSWKKLLTAVKTPNLIELCMVFETIFWDHILYVNIIKTVCIFKQVTFKHIQLEITVNSFISNKANRLKIGILNTPPPPKKKLMIEENAKISNLLWIKE